MQLPFVPLLVPVASVTLPGPLLSEKPHENAPGATVRGYETPLGNVLLTEWQGLVHEIIYQCPFNDEAMSEERNNLLFDFYSDGQPWNNILDNGFGVTYRREDMKRYALYSYTMDYNTFGTMEFHAVKWR